ncbi:MAG: hypothetical protein WCJ75_14615, partial [Desulfomonile sp.]
DKGLSRFLSEIEDHGRTSSERLALKLRWRKKRTRTLHCPTSLLDYLRLFHDEEQEKQRVFEGNERGIALSPLLVSVGKHEEQ